MLHLLEYHEYGKRGKGSQAAINQMIDLISPEGSISLLGVSEYGVEINTRMVLEKGLTLFGSSRSGAQDFKDVAQLCFKCLYCIVDGFNFIFFTF